MALMNGSPVLNDRTFGREASSGYGAAPADTMTVNGTITATAVLGVLLLAAAAFGWTQVAEEPVALDSLRREINTVTPPGWMMFALLGALGLGLVTGFVPKAARITAPLYALAMGGVLGVFSKFYNVQYDGIVTQALFATMGIFTAMLVLYATRIIKVTNKFVMVVAGATMGIFLMYLIAFVMSLFGARPAFLGTEFSPLGLGISLVIIVVAALNLAINFAFIEKASQHGVPKYMEWYAAYGLVVTLVWIYLEVLRLLAMLNNRN